MISSHKWETIISVVVIVAIISIVLVSLFKIIEYDNELNFQYDKTNYISVLEKNTNSLIKQIDTSLVKEKETFYLHKTESDIVALTGSENIDYKFINYLWEHINTGSYMWAIYSRFCLVEKDAPEWQMIKCSVKEMIRK